MRAKNEAKFLAEAYDTVIYERVVNGVLMCPEACCGKPVMECKCGPDCEHCNCHEIQKLAAKEEDAEGALGNLVKGVGRGVGDIATGVGRVGLAAGGAGAAAAGGALGAALKIAKTLTADQLQKLGEYALKKSSEDEEGTEDIFPNSPYGDHLRRAAAEQEQEDKEDKEVPERTKLLIQLVADGYVRLHRDGEFQVLAPWQGSTSFPILKGQGWKKVPFPSIRLTRPGESTVQLRPPYTDIQTYLKDGYEVVEDYVKATQSEDNEENEDENLEVTQGDTSAADFTDEVEHTPY